MAQKGREIGRYEVTLPDRRTISRPDHIQVARSLVAEIIDDHSTLEVAEMRCVRSENRSVVLRFMLAHESPPLAGVVASRSTSV